MTSLIKENYVIVPRRPIFDFTETPRHWIYDDPMVSQILNSINPITPAFRYFSDSNILRAGAAILKNMDKLN